MKNVLSLDPVLIFLSLILASTASFGSDASPIELWPETVPGEKGNLGEERDTTRPTDDLVAGRSVVRLGNVSRPTLTVFSPDPGKNTGAAVLVCPGGGYHILAMDLEGTEICEWLSSVGVTGVLLKYRVPRREGSEKHSAPLQDAQRAMGMIRERASELGIDPHRIGVLGFSAGGHLAAALSTNTKERMYARIDAADDMSCRPDFTVLIYPAYLVTPGEQEGIAPELTIDATTPPAFLVMCQDDPVGVNNALGYTRALQKAGVSTELHIYPTGGHGYGLRRTDQPVTTWPDRASDWMRSRGLLNR